MAWVIPIDEECYCSRTKIIINVKKVGDKWDWIKWLGHINYPLVPAGLLGYEVLNTKWWVLKRPAGETVFTNRYFKPNLFKVKWRLSPSSLLWIHNINFQSVSIKLNQTFPKSTYFQIIMQHFKQSSK